MDAAWIIKELGLQKLPEEGGFYSEVYRSKDVLPGFPLPSGRDRVYGTDIYYLMTPEEFSGLHRVRSSIEIWNFYSGDPAEMVQIDPNGNVTRITIGPDLSKGQQPKVIVPAGHWQGARLAPGGKWALVGCTCVPGFEFEDFEGGSLSSLGKIFPQHIELIKKYTHG